MLRWSDFQSCCHHVSPCLKTDIDNVYGGLTRLHDEKQMKDAFTDIYCLLRGRIKDKNSAVFTIKFQV